MAVPEFYKSLSCSRDRRLLPRSIACPGARVIIGSIRF